MAGIHRISWENQKYLRAFQKQNACQTPKAEEKLCKKYNKEHALQLHPKKSKHVITFYGMRFDT
jgi:hypothetical protein